MTLLTSMTIAEARIGLANRSFTSLELTDAHLAAIEAARTLNAFILETPEQARAMARAVDAKIAKREGGPLAGRAASRRRSRQPSASSRPMAAARAGASWRLPRRSIRQVPLRAPPAMPQS